MDYASELERISQDDTVAKSMFDYTTTLKEKASDIKASKDAGTAAIIEQVGVPITASAGALISRYTEINPENAIKGLKNIKSAIQGGESEAAAAAPVSDVVPKLPDGIAETNIDEASGATPAAPAATTAAEEGAEDTAALGTEEEVGAALDATDILAPIGVAIQIGGVIAEGVKAAIDLFKSHHESYTPPTYEGPPAPQVTLASYVPT